MSLYRFWNIRAIIHEFIRTRDFSVPLRVTVQPRSLWSLIDKCHQNGIDVIMDFVPAHFAIDGYGIRNFDGTPIYEYPHTDVGMANEEAVTLYIRAARLGAFYNRAPRIS